MSRSLKSVGPNATLVEDDIEAVIRGLKAQLVGEIDVAGPDLAGSLTDLGLIDEYRLYLHPVVLGRGKPFFSGPRPPLRLVASDRIGEDVIRLTYVPAEEFARDSSITGKHGAIQKAMPYSTSSTCTVRPDRRWASEASMNGSRSPSSTSAGVPEVWPVRRSLTIW